MSSYSPDVYMTKKVCNYLLHDLENLSKNFNLSFFLDSICKCYKKTNSKNRYQQLNVVLDDEDISLAVEEGRNLFFLVTRSKTKYRDEGEKYKNLKKMKRMNSNTNEYLLFTIEDVDFHPYSRFLKIVEEDDYQHLELSDEEKLIDTVYEALPLRQKGDLEKVGRKISRKKDLPQEIYLRIYNFAVH